MWSFASLEAQVAAIADDIAYDAHDIDDGLRAGLFGLDDLAACRAAGPNHRRDRAAYPGLDDARVGARIGARADRPLDRGRRRRDRRSARRARAAFGRRRPASAVGAGRVSRRRGGGGAADQGFLETRMYRHARVMRVMGEAADVLRDLFARYSEHPGDLPAEWREGLSALERAGARAPDRQFHRRDDRPLRAHRTPAAF